MGILKKLQHAWDAFTDTTPAHVDYGSSYGSQPYRGRRGYAYDKTIVTSIYTRIAIDVAAIDLRHVRLDDQDRYQEDMNTNLHKCLTLRANIDQAARAFRQDMAMTLVEVGVIAIVPVRTSLNPNNTGGYDIHELRVGEITEWFPQHVRVRVYNEETGRSEDLIMKKSVVAIVPNPFYAVMNQPNSTLQRLLRKLQQLDSVDEQSASGKLDLIIQLPYAIKSETKRAQAEQRRKDIEFQLKGSQYGIAYTDGTEKVTQLNRPAENNLFKQVEYLEEKLYGELGLTKEIMNGTADEATMLNYNNRTLDPIVSAIREAMMTTFLTKTALSQRQAIMSFHDPFKLVPLSTIAEIGDKLTRNEVVSSNEMRGFIGLKPSKDPKADELKNSNMPAPSGLGTSSETQEKGDSQNGT